MVKTVPEILREGAETYEIRNKLYGDNYKRHGSIMQCLFPNGVELLNDDDHMRFGLLTQKVAKLTRYCENFTDGGHSDSLHDDMVYTAMLLEVDTEINANEDLAEKIGTESKPKYDPTKPLEVDWSALQEPPQPRSIFSDVDTFGPGAVPEPSTPPEQDRYISEAELVEALKFGTEPDNSQPPVVIPEPPKQK